MLNQQEQLFIIQTSPMSWNLMFLLNFFSIILLSNIKDKKFLKFKNFFKFKKNSKW